MLVLMTLKELHACFTDQYPGIKISFSKFAEQRPRQCVLAGASGTHSVCVCIYHENFSLLLDAAHFEKEENGKKTAMTMREVLKLAVCEEEKPECYLGECNTCPGPQRLQEIMEANFDERMQSEVQFRKWVSVDRATLETTLSSVEDFIENVTEALPSLLHHHFICKAQAKFLNDLKTSLKVSECIIIGDFSENYTSVHQDAPQGVHWKKTQTGLHPFTCYHRPSPESELKVLNFSVITDYLDHDTISVYSFQHVLLPHLKSIIPSLNRVYYFSDGASSQYKNRQNSCNLRMHFEDFGIDAEWHFFASCHGKGPCDGIGGTIKREARMESLRRISKGTYQRESIVTAKELFDWCKEKFANSITVFFVSAAEIENMKITYSDRFKGPPPIDGIASCHCIVPLSKNSLLMKLYSSAPTCQYVYYGGLHAPEFSDVHGFLIITQKESWQLAFVDGVNIQNQSVEVRVLVRDGASQHFSFPTEDYSATISCSDILTVVNIVPVAANKFKVPRKCIQYANAEQLKRHPAPPQVEKRTGKKRKR